jgi:hypothetical protein
VVRPPYGTVQAIWSDITEDEVIAFEEFWRRVPAGWRRRKGERREE